MGVTYPPDPDIVVYKAIGYRPIRVGEFYLDSRGEMRIASRFFSDSETITTIYELVKDPQACLGPVYDQEEE